MKKILLIIQLFISTLIAFAQTDSVLTLKRSISYYSNGNPKELITFNTDSCKYIDCESVQSEYTDICMDGLYCKWYLNGQIKTSGQYKYDQFDDKIIVMDPYSGKLDTNVISNMRSVKTGLWINYDSMGSKLSISRFVNDRLIALKSNNRDTTINVEKDSVWIKLDDYSETNSYLINRTNNKKLILQFPIHEIHNYWFIYNNKKVDLLYDNYPFYNLFSWDKPLVALISDDCHDDKQYYYDFSKLTDGRYYVYYWTHIGTFHMIEIILNEI